MQTTANRILDPLVLDPLVTVALVVVMVERMARLEQLHEALKGASSPNRPSLICHHHLPILLSLDDALGRNASLPPSRRPSHIGYQTQTGEHT